jgi:hypothetical protein
MSENKNSDQNVSLALTEEESLRKLVQQNELIFIGSVLALGKPPKSWSGFFLSYQPVKYKIEKLLKGQYGASEISVEHIIVSGSPTAQSGDTPGLSPSLFAVGSRLIVSAQKADNGIWKDLDDEFGALKSDQWEKKIEAAIRAK